MRREVFSLFILSFLALTITAVPLYVVDGNDAIRVGEVKNWKKPFVELTTVSTAMGLKWSFKDGIGVVTNGKDFVSFNVKTHGGTFDALYKMDDVASGNTEAWISLEAIAKLAGLTYEKENVGYILLRKKPTLQFNGALLYGGKFTLFFKESPLPFTIRVKSHGMKTMVTVFPVTVSKEYVPIRSPLVEENIGKYSVTYTITYSGPVKILTSLGYPSLPVQSKKSLSFKNGVTFHILEFKTSTDETVHVGVLKVPHGVKTRIVYPSTGVGQKELLASMVPATSLAAAGFPASNVGFIMKNGELIHASSEDGPLLVWNDQKFDIIETSPTISVNIGNVPFGVDSVNKEKGNVILYSHRYGPVIPREASRVYYVVRNGRIVSESYTAHAEKNEYVLSLTKAYAIFLKNVEIGDDFCLFISFGEPIGSEKHDEIIQGESLLVSSSEKVPWLSAKNVKGRIFFVAAVKDEDLYLLRFESTTKIDLGEIANMLVNMGFSKAMLVGKGNAVTMIVNGKVVEFERKGLYPVGFGIEIDKTTGGA